MKVLEVTDAIIQGTLRKKRAVWLSITQLSIRIRNQKLLSSARGSQFLRLLKKRAILALFFFLSAERTVFQSSGLYFLGKVGLENHVVGEKERYGLFSSIYLFIFIYLFFFFFLVVLDSESNFPCNN